MVQMSQQVRAQFAARHEQGHADERALELVAFDLRLSVSDCAVAIGREDLQQQLGDHWTLEFPEIGPPAMRRR